MIFQGFEGPAGTGKTYQLVRAVVGRLIDRPLEPHQRVLALTFMNASRRRLDQRFAEEPQLRNRYSCMTIDAFSREVAHRWRGCLESTVQPEEFDKTCDVCGSLLERPNIAKWIARTYPIVVVDEAQELGVERLRVIRALAAEVDLYVAADEFQCLDPKVDTKPFVEWFETGDVMQLSKVRRTSQRGLLDAAVAIRAGRKPLDGPGIQIRYAFPNQMPFSIGHSLVQGVRAGPTALVCAPGSRQWADELIGRLSAGLKSKKQTVPSMRIDWEARKDADVAKLLQALDGTDLVAMDTILGALARLPSPQAWVRQVADALDHQRRVQSKVHWQRSELVTLFKRKAAIHAAYSPQRHRGIPVMTVSGAKNREFQHVVVLWAPGVEGDADQQRRLLYNAITRAQISCKVFVRTEPLLAQPPFAV